MGKFKIPGSNYMVTTHQPMSAPKDESDQRLQNATVLDRLKNGGPLPLKVRAVKPGELAPRGTPPTPVQPPVVPVVAATTPPPAIPTGKKKTVVKEAESAVADDTSRQSVVGIDSTSQGRIRDRRNSETGVTDVEWQEVGGESEQTPHNRDLQLLKDEINDFARHMDNQLDRLDAWSARENALVDESHRRTQESHRRTQERLKASDDAMARGNEAMARGNEAIARARQALQKRGVDPDA